MPHHEHFTEEQLGFGEQMIITERVPDLETRVARLERYIASVVAAEKCPVCGHTSEGK